MKKLEDYFKEPPKPGSKKHAKSLKALKKQTIQEHSQLMKILENEESLSRELFKN